MTRDQSLGLAEPRTTVQVALPDGRSFQGPLGTTLRQFVEAAYPDVEVPIVAALVDGELHELSYSLQRDAEILPIDTSANDGMRIYHRSLAFLLLVAAQQLFPQACIRIDHSVTLGGFFCQVEKRPLFTEDELQAIEGRMRQIIADDEPIFKERMSTREALAMFQEQGYDDKVRLLSGYGDDTVTVYRLCGVRNYFYGHMTPSTRALGHFHLEYYPPGFIIRLPGRHAPVSLPEAHDYPKLMQVFQRYGKWIEILGVESVGSLNQAVDDGSVRSAILVAEALHEKRISDIADDIVARHDSTRVVLVAGPSSSGKTTFSRRLAIQLMVTGLRPYAIGLDDYFVNRDQTPRDASGDYDFEALEAINVGLFNQQLMALMAGERVQLPHYDFMSGRSQPGREVQLGPDAVIIVEGIHGLNPDLVPGLPSECVFRIYASALTQLNIDRHNRVPTTDTRLIRRIVRDARDRGYSAQSTIARWESVRSGEERNIFPYQENADVMFNSALVYELAVLRPFAEPLLREVAMGTREMVEARRLLAFLRWVRPCQPDFVPDNSLLREFIGGSILRDFAF